MLGVRGGWRRDYRAGQSADLRGPTLFIWRFPPAGIRIRATLPALSRSCETRRDTDAPPEPRGGRGGPSSGTGWDVVRRGIGGLGCRSSPSWYEVSAGSTSSRKTRTSGGSAPPDPSAPTAGSGHGPALDGLLVAHLVRRGVPGEQLAVLRREDVPTRHVREPEVVACQLPAPSREELLARRDVPLSLGGAISSRHAGMITDPSTGRALDSPGSSPRSGG